MSGGRTRVLRCALCAAVAIFFGVAHAARAQTANPLFAPPSLPPPQRLAQSPPPPSPTTPPQVQRPAGVAQSAGDSKEASDSSADQPDEEGSGDDRLGQEPPADSLDFFRQSTVLLNPGTIEWEFGTEYSLVENNFLTILPNGAIVPEATSARTFVNSVALRYGLSERFQPSIVLPFGLATIEQANSTGQLTDVSYGIGDVLVGGSYLLRDGEDKRSDVVATLNVVAPTGNAVPVVNPRAAAFLGGGFWSISAALNWTRTFDPVVVFASTGYTYRFERELLGQHVSPGGEVNLACGFGLAINEELTYSMQFQNGHQFDTKVSGRKIRDSGVDFATLRHSAIIRRAPQDFYEVFIATGLTDASTDVSTGVLFTRRY